MWWSRRTCSATSCSDEAGAIAGSLGLLPSASLGDGVVLYEPVRGSAPTIAAKDICNPIGTVDSLALLLRSSAKAEDQAAGGGGRDRLFRAEAGCWTVDIAEPGQPSLGCAAMAKEIAARIDGGCGWPGPATVAAVRS